MGVEVPQGGFTWTGPSRQLVSVVRLREGGKATSGCGTLGSHHGPGLCGGNVTSTCLVFSDQLRCHSERIDISNPALSTRPFCILKISYFTKSLSSLKRCAICLGCTLII